MSGSTMSTVLGEQGYELAKKGLFAEALTMFQRAASEAQAERPPECLECGGKEGYWASWWTAHASFLEVLLSAQTRDRLTNVPTHGPIAILLTTIL